MAAAPIRPRSGAVPVVMLAVAAAIVGCGGADESSSDEPIRDDVAVTPATESRSRDLLPRLDSPADGSTMDADPNLGGFALSRDGDGREVTIELWRGDGPSGEPIATIATPRSDQGAFSARLGSPLGSGRYSARATQVDSDGTTRRSELRRFTVDAEAPPLLLAAGDIGGCSTSGDEATATLLDGLPGTVAALGDIAYDHGTDAEFDCYDAAWGRHKARVRPVLGDHDYDTRKADPYFDYFGMAAGARDEGYYSYELGDWHVVALNSNCSRIGGCEPGTRQLRWLRRDLAASDATCTLAYFANPVFSSGEIHGNQRSPLPLWDELYESGAEVVLSADDHIYERFAPQSPDGEADPDRGIREFIVGTGGRSLYEYGEIQPNSEVRNNDAFGILKLTLLPDRYRWEFVAEEGRSFSDGGETECH